MTVSDHIQKVLKPNFAAAWEEVGDAFEKEETFALSSTKTLEGKKSFAASGLPGTSLTQEAHMQFQKNSFLLSMFKSSTQN